MVHMPGRHHRQRTAVEDTAAAAAAYLCGATARRIDLGRADALRDFDLVFPDGRCEPFEVTVSAHEATRRTWNRVFGNPVKANLERLWVVSLPAYLTDDQGHEHPIDRNQIERELVPVLQDLEANGVESFDERDYWGRLTEFRELFEGLGVRVAHSIDVAPPRKGELVLSTGGGGAVWIDSIADAVEREARKPDNRAKLAGAAGARRRHLCVVIDLSNGLAHLATGQVRSDGRTPRVPDLPPPITTVWALTDREALVVTPPGSWAARAIPEEVRENPERWITH